MSRHEFYQDAFHRICDQAKSPERWYVVLTCSYEAYGGPEEGGWWYTCAEVVAFQEFATEDAAEAAAGAVEELAKKMSNDARREYGNQCLRETQWCEDRGLDADYLPEPDGPDEYRVRVMDHIPTFDNRRPTYS